MKLPAERPLLMDMRGTLLSPNGASTLSEETLTEWRRMPAAL